MTNAAAAEVKGFDVEVAARPVRSLNIYGNLAYIDATYSKFAPFVARLPQVDAAGRPTGGTVGTQVNLKGNPLVQAPKWTLNLGFAFEEPIASNVDFLLNGDAIFRSSYSMNPERTVVQDSYAQFNASVGLQTTRGPYRYRAMLWGRNLTDQDILNNAGAVTNTLRASHTEPRTFGVRLSVER